METIQCITQYSRRWPEILTGLLILSLAAPVFCQTPSIVLENQTRHIAVRKGIEYLVEETPLDHFTVSDRTHDDRWKKIKTKSINFGSASSPTWFRFRIDTPSGQDTDWLLEIGWPLLDRIDVHAYNRTRSAWTTEYVAGNRMPMANRPLQHRNFLFPLDLKPHETSDIYIRVDSRHPLILTVDLHQSEAFWQSNQSQVLLFGAFFGILGVMFFYNLSLYYFTRDNNYFYYSFYVLSIILFTLAKTGLGNQYIWGDLVVLQRKTYIVFAMVSFLTGTLFARKFLSLKQYGGWVLHINTAFLVYWVFALFSSAFWLNPVFLKATEPVVMMSCIAILATSTYLWIKKNTSAKYYTIAWCAEIIGTFYYTLSTWGAVDRTPFSQHAQLVGFVLEVVLLSWALGERINRERKEREKMHRVSLELSEKVSRERAEKLKAQQQILQLQRQSNEELEQRVAHRTLELEQAVADKAEHLAALEKTLQEIKTLKGIIPICSYCKSIRNDQGAWSRMEKYIGEHSDAQFSHGICPECYKKISGYDDYPDGMNTDFDGGKLK